MATESTSMEPARSSVRVGALAFPESRTAVDCRVTVTSGPLGIYFNVAGNDLKRSLFVPWREAGGLSADLAALVAGAPIDVQVDVEMDRNPRPALPGDGMQGDG